MPRARLVKRAQAIAFWPYFQLSKKVRDSYLSNFRFANLSFKFEVLKLHFSVWHKSARFKLDVVVCPLTDG